MRNEAIVMAQLNQWRNNNPTYHFSDQEAACLQSFNRAPYYIVGLNSLGFGGLGVYALNQGFKPNGLSIWMSAWGVVAAVAGAFAGVVYTTRLAHRTCFQCVLDIRDKQTLFHQATREVLKNHHPDASAYFKREKYKLLVPSSAAGYTRKPCLH